MIAGYPRRRMNPEVDQERMVPLCTGIACARARLCSSQKFHETLPANSRGKVATSPSVPQQARELISLRLEKGEGSRRCDPEESRARESMKGEVRH
jgi:hypothetical protein